MSQSVITTAFEQLKAEQAANGGILTLDEFVFANVPNLNITDPIDRGESWPAPEQIVHRQDVSKTGTVNGNAVVYSVVLGAETGDFDFNWIGLINKASNTVAMIVHAPVQKKIKTASGQQGNVLTRSFMMEYNGASQITQITTPADTWQIDFTARLAGMDERIRKENMDTYGTASFYHDGFLVSREDGGYSVKKGVGYVAGLRAELLLDKEIAAAELPVKVWVDVCWKGLLTSVWGVETKIVVAETLNDYSDNGQPHYVFAVAEIQDDGAVVDLRGSPVKPDQEIIDDIAADLKNKQPLNNVLTALAKNEGEEDKLPYFNDKGRLDLTVLTELARNILKQEHADGVLSELGLEYLPDSFGSAAEKDIGTKTGQVPDMSSFASLKEANGWFKLPNGMIIQWGRGVEAANINFPIPFPTACICLQACKLAETGSGIGSIENAAPTVVAINNASSFGMSFGALNGNSMYFMALGY